MTPVVTVFVQARMSSRRFPGKVLAPFRGQPIIRHVLESVRAALPAAPLVVATSVETSDDPLAAYVTSLGLPVFRGALADVFRRFRDGLDRFPCEWLLRVSGDSPLLSPVILRAVADRAHDSAPQVDLVTTVFPRTFPSGQNAELIRAASLRAIDMAVLTDHDREHVTPFFYRNSDRFGIVNVSSGRAGMVDISLAVDTPQDLERLEASTEAEIEAIVSACRV